LTLFIKTAKRGGLAPKKFRWGWRVDSSHWRRIVLVSVFLSLFFLSSSSTTNAQGIVTGTISGSLEDPQGGAVAGATVFAVQATTTTRFESKTDTSGYFEFRALPIGTYTVRIEAAGFRVRQLNNVAVEAGRTTSVGAQKLEIGATAETVTVEASAPLI